MQSLEGFVVLSDSYKDPETFKFISETSKERYKQYNKGHHEWINKIEPGKFRDSLESVRQNKAFIDSITKIFPNSYIKPVTESDEVYWSVSPKDAKGSDRTLVDCHYDAPFSIVPTGGVTFYRILIAMNENDTVTTVFPNEGKKVKMNTGDYHGLDFNKDWHCVEGSIPANKYRILLKLHYIIIPDNTSQFWIDWVRFINVNYNYLSRETMRMSANPKTPFETFIGFIVNTIRELYNNINTIVIYILIFILIVFIYKRTYGSSKKRSIIKKI